MACCRIQTVWTDHMAIYTVFGFQDALIRFEQAFWFCMLNVQTSAIWVKFPTSLNITNATRVSQREKCYHRILLFHEFDIIQCKATSWISRHKHAGWQLSMPTTFHYKITCFIPSWYHAAREFLIYPQAPRHLHRFRKIQECSRKFRYLCSIVNVSHNVMLFSNDRDAKRLSLTYPTKEYKRHCKTNSYKFLAKHII